MLRRVDTSPAFQPVHGEITLAMLRCIWGLRVASIAQASPMEVFAAGIPIERQQPAAPFSADARRIVCRRRTARTPADFTQAPASNDSAAVHRASTSMVPAEIRPVTRIAVAGYTKPMPEAPAADRLATCRRLIVAPRVHRRSGRSMKLKGFGVLVGAVVDRHSRQRAARRHAARPPRLRPAGGVAGDDRACSLRCSPMSAIR